MYWKTGWESLARHNGGLPASQEFKFQSQKDTYGYWIFSESGRRIRFTQILFMIHTSLMMPGSGVRSHASQIRKLLATCMKDFTRFIRQSAVLQEAFTVM